MVEGKIIKDPWFLHVFAVTEIKCPICGKPMASMVWDAEYWYRCTNLKCGYQTPVRGDWNESLAAMPQTTGKTDTRGTGPDSVRVRRKRKCHECGYIWSTIELDEVELTRLEACARVMRSIYTLMLKEDKHGES